MHRTLGTLIAATALLPLPAMAQSLTADRILPLEDWDQDSLYTGVSVEQMLDEYEVYGVGGEEIGSVENVLIGADGRVLSIIAQVGGFWDIGDTHVNVPWDRVDLSQAGRVMIPVTEDTVDDYSLFSDEVVSANEATGAVQVVDDDLETSGRVWRATRKIRPIESAALPPGCEEMVAEGGIEPPTYGL